MTINDAEESSHERAGHPPTRTPPTCPDAAVPAVVIVHEDGTVVAQNEPALRLIGHGVGRFCWDVVGGIEDAEGLPCAKGCASKLVARGIGRSKHASLRLRGQHLDLTCVSLEAAAVCLLSCRTGRRPKPWEWLTVREREVLCLLAEGETTASLAAHLRLSESTVRTHVEHMRRKLRVHTRSALVAVGFRLGFLD